MAQEQFGICAEANLHGLFLMFNAHDGREAFIRESLAKLPEIFEEIGEQFSESMVSTVVAIGANYWDDLYPNKRPNQLRPFPAMEYADRSMPAVPYDLYIQIRSDRADVNHLVGLRVCSLLSNAVELVEQVKGFRYLDGRDLTGFVDGTENPKGRHKRKVALVSPESDPDFEGGSYIHMQRYRHNLSSWEHLSLQEQEDIVGRTKIENVEYKSEDKSPCAHIKRVNLKNSNNESLEILRQSMPYGHMKIQGLLFISCCATPENFELMLESMVKGDEEGNYDHMLSFTQAETGAAFFAPALGFLKNQGE